MPRVRRRCRRVVPRRKEAPRRRVGRLFFASKGGSWEKPAPRADCRWRSRSFQDPSSAAAVLQEFFHGRQKVLGAEGLGDIGVGPQLLVDLGQLAGLEAGREEDDRNPGRPRSRLIALPASIPPMPRACACRARSGRRGIVLEDLQGAFAVEQDTTSKPARRRYSEDKVFVTFSSSTTSIFFIRRVSQREFGLVPRPGLSTDLAAVIGDDALADGQAQAHCRESSGRWDRRRSGYRRSSTGAPAGSGPWSETLISVMPSLRRHEMVIVPFGGEYLSAFPQRLSRTR